MYTYSPQCTFRYDRSIYVGILGEGRYTFSDELRLWRVNHQNSQLAHHKHLLRTDCLVMTGQKLRTLYYNRSVLSQRILASIKRTFLKVRMSYCMNLSLEVFSWQFKSGSPHTFATHNICLSLLSTRIAMHLLYCDLVFIRVFLKVIICASKAFVTRGVYLVDWWMIISTLLEEQCALSAVPVLSMAVFSWKFISGSRGTFCRNGVCLVVIGQ
jgi:hypothetical protein